VTVPQTSRRGRPDRGAARLLTASGEPPSADTLPGAEPPPGGAHANPAAITQPGPETNPFAESQLAGLEVAIALARADAATVLAPARPRRPPPGGAEAGLAAQQGPAADRFAYLRAPLLAAVLALQAVLSLRLVWSNATFVSEAANLAAGHAELAHWLHGTPVAQYATNFAGAPVIYPPVAAIAANLGGLVAARVLSLVFMLAATALLWAMTSRLLGRSAAVCAATLFAIIGPTLQLGASATFDAMALFLLAAGAWCVVRAQDREDSALLLLAGILLLTLANATRYSTVLFDPPVFALAGLSVARIRGAKAGVARTGYVAAATIALISVTLAVGGSSYVAGVLHTVVAAPAGPGRAVLVLATAAKWAGAICALAVAGLVVCAVRKDGRVQFWTIAVLAAAGVLALLDQVRLHATGSLPMHADFGAWFAAAGAGYAISRLCQVIRPRTVRVAAAGIVLAGIAVPAGSIGQAQARQAFSVWPVSARQISGLAPILADHPGQYLAEDFDIPAYYLEARVPLRRWSSTWYFTYRPPGSGQTLGGLAAYRAAISHHYFALVILSFEQTLATDRQLRRYLSETPGYRVIASPAPLYTIWAYEPPDHRVGPHDDG
jgi:hypothetical protein